jgi:hypothetical protein
MFEGKTFQIKKEEPIITNPNIQVPELRNIQTTFTGKTFQITQATPELKSPVGISNVEQIQINLYRNLPEDKREKLSPEIKRRMENLSAYPYGKPSSIPTSHIPATIRMSSQEELEEFNKQPGVTWEDRLQVMEDQTKNLAWKYPDKISHYEYIRKGISFGYGNVPEPPPTTTQQKFSQAAGRIMSMVFLRNVGSTAIKAGVAKTALAEPVAKLGLLSKTLPWKVGYPLSVLQSGLWGSFLGALTKADSIEERVNNAIQTGKWFAAFQTIAYPVQMFLFDSMVKLGEEKYQGISKEARTMLDSKETKVLISKGPDTVWFRHPENPNSVFKVTEKGIFGVPQGQAPAQPIPIFKEQYVESFRYNEAIYKKLLGVLKKGKAPVDPVKDAVDSIIKKPVETIIPTPGTKPIKIPDISNVNLEINHNQEFTRVQTKLNKEGTESLTPSEMEVLSQGPIEVITPDGVQKVSPENSVDNMITELYAGVPLGELAKLPVTVRGAKRAIIDALGSMFLRKYGLTPETKNILTRLEGSQDLRKEDLSHFFINQFPIDKEQAKLLTNHQENPDKYPINPELQPFAEKVEDLINLSKQIQESREMQGEFFPESFIKRAQKEIAQHKELMPKLTKEKAINNHKNKIQELEEYIELLNSLRYVPHAYLASESIQQNILGLLPEGRITSKFRDTLNKLRGRQIATLDDAKEAGLLPEEDIRVLLASHFEYLYRKVAIHDAVEELKKNKTAVLPEADAPEGWEKVAISQLDGYKVNPFLVDYIENFTTKFDTNIIAKGYDALNYLGKSIFFYNPIINPFWNAFQGYAAGSIKPWRPIYSSKLMIQAVRDVVGKTELYRDAVERQLYTTPHEGRFSTPIESTMRVMTDKIEKSYPGWKKVLEGIVGHQIDWRTYTVIPDLYNANWKFVWSMDRIIRTATLRHGLNMGMDIDTAVKYANNFHANYNLFTKKSKKWLNRIFLVPTYKSNMLFNLPSYIAKNTFEIAKAIPKGEKATPEQKAAASAIFRIGLFFAAMLSFAAWRGYHLREGYRLVKKLKEPEITDEGKILTEGVITLPGPFAELPKFVARLKMGVNGMFMYMAKVPQMIWGLNRNARWTGEPYYDKGAAKEVQRRTAIVGLLKDYLAFYGQYDVMTQEEQDAFSNIMGLFGMATYKRGSTEQKIFWDIQRKKNELDKYLQKPNVKWEDKQKAIDEFESFIGKQIQDLEDFIQLYE